MTIKDKIWARVHKAPDLDLAIKITTIEGQTYVNLRDYVPSTKEFGKGILFPVALASEVAEALIQIRAQYGTGNGKPSSDQASLL